MRASRGIRRIGRQPIVLTNASIGFAIVAGVGVGSRIDSRGVRVAYAIRGAVGLAARSAGARRARGPRAARA